MTAHVLRPRRKLVVAGAVLAALLLPASVVASHIFSDVPTGMTGHAAIEAIYDAGITGGCGGTKYCPSDPVTRAQMALFMQRGFPRVAFGPTTGGDQIGSDDTGTTIDLMTLHSAGGSGKTQFVKVDASVTLDITDVTGCPCEVKLSLAAGSEIAPFLTFATVVETGRQVIPLTFAAPIDTNTDVPIGVVADFDPDIATPVITGTADITAITAPFGSSGTDVLAEGAQSPAGPRANPRK